MDFLSHLLAITGLLALVMLYKLSRIQSHKNKGNSPPEIRGGLPVIGHLHQLGGQKPLFRTLSTMADKYGPIFTFRLGVRPVLVVSSWEAVKECFTTNDRAFAARPQSKTGKHLSHNGAAFGFAPYGPYWREMRKLAVLELLSTRRLEMLKHVRVSEVSTSIRELYCLSRKSNRDISPVRVVISEWIDQLSLNIIVRMVAGKRYFKSTGGARDEKAWHFRKVIKEFMYITGTSFALSDAIPFPVLGWIDLLGSLRHTKNVMKELDSIVESWLQEHIQRRVESDHDQLGNEQDFIDVMLSVIDDKLSSEHTRETIIKATILNIILAGSDTTSVNLTWLLSLLLNNKDELKRAQVEIDTKVGKNRWVEESDIKHLVYLQAIAKETLRLYPPGPLSVPHQAIEDCQVGGYDIPKGTRLLVNLWKMHRDPRIWSDPEKFKPERFLTRHAQVDVWGQHFEFTPFGSGRRACPGIALATQVTHLTVAQLIQGFDFTTPSNEPVDMTEGSSINLPIATPLEVLVTPRLSRELYEQ